jgi:hypothetical protein
MVRKERMVHRIIYSIILIQDVQPIILIDESGKGRREIFAYYFSLCC